MILLLYDTKEKDLARDLQDFLGHLDIEATMIPRAPNLGLTLQAKEAKYYDECEGIVFLITPGSLRDGKDYPSPSVIDEMGQAKNKFAANPEKVIYLVDHRCSIQAIDQKTYIQYTHDDMRSVLEAITLLIQDLKVASVFSSPGPAGAQADEYDEADIVSKIYSWVENKYGSLGEETLEFDQLDYDIGLPAGASKKYFGGIAEKLNYKVVIAGNKTIRLKYMIEEV